eukprot:CAMPEP_0169146086 /NCGR_PEP_ID=MMETSP1015-20121227/47324_1 /TAXON_ID=342587 /ORGANISM="Karlodinium micrum, Strain CCMP2283" /LENGTH=146 /DNA_ID=CAMNT_0009213853 /DNA_START=263 /DNA_END=704 /DNA_ORIENTATION=-
MKHVSSTIGNNFGHSGTIKLSHVPRRASNAISVRTNSRSCRRGFSRVDASLDGGPGTARPSPPTPPCDEPPSPEHAPPPLLRDVICCVKATSTLGGGPPPSRGILKLVSDDVAFLYIVPGVCCGDDGDAGPRGGLKGASKQAPGGS